MTNSSTIEPLRSSKRRHRFGNQSFRRLAKRSADVGLAFNDDKFIQNDRHVYQTSAFRSRFNIGKVVWKRPKQLLQENGFGNFEATLLPFFKTNRNHLFVGHSPNPWLVAAALAVSQHRSLLEQLVNIDQQHFRDQGIVRFTIWQMGVMHKVVVDDRLPSIDSEPIFTRPILSYSSWWVPMLEKAYAKLYGSYEQMIANGSLHSALIDFTGGGSVETIDLSQYCNNNSCEQLWSIISREFNSKSLLILKTKELKSNDNGAPFGLVSNRYYLIRQIKKPMGTLKRLLSSNHSSSITQSNQDNLPLLITNTIADGINSKSTTNSTKKSLQELWILSNNIVNLFDTLTICHPYQSNKNFIHQLIYNRTDNSLQSSSLQFRFDVRPMSNCNNFLVKNDDNCDKDNQQCINVNFNLIQKNTPIIPIGFCIYSIEMNRKYKVHQFSSLPLITTVDPIQSRNLIVTISLPALNGRYLLKPINTDSISTLLLSIYSIQVTDFNQLTMDMPKHYQYLSSSFMTPVYPNAMTRIQVLAVENIERQDRFGTANPYCIIRCGSKYVKSSIEYEKLMPVWENFSAIFYHRDINKMEPIFIEVWHHGILVDYFLGAIKFKPKITLTLLIDDGDSDETKQQQQDINELQIEKSKHCDSNNVETINDEQSSTAKIDQSSKINDDDDDVICLQLMDKKGHTKRPGFVLFRSKTVEDLKYF